MSYSQTVRVILSDYPCCTLRLSVSYDWCHTFSYQFSCCRWSERGLLRRLPQWRWTDLLRYVSQSLPRYLPCTWADRCPQVNDAMCWFQMPLCSITSAADCVAAVTWFLNIQCMLSVGWRPLCKYQATQFILEPCSLALVRISSRP